MISTPLARPLLEELARQIGRKGAYVYQRLDFTGATGGGVGAWVETAPDELLGRAPADRPSHDRERRLPHRRRRRPRTRARPPGSRMSRMAKLDKAYRPAMERVVSGKLAWVGCQFPCPALAQEAGMTPRLRGLPLRRLSDRLGRRARADAGVKRTARRRRRDSGRRCPAPRSRSVSPAREGMVDAGGANMPGGEVFYSPVEDSANGEISFSEFPAVYARPRAAGHPPSLRERRRRRRVRGDRRGVPARGARHGRGRAQAR